MSDHGEQRTDRAVDYEALYLGGHPQFAIANDPIVGRLTLRGNHVVFEVMGDFFEPLFAIRWDQIDLWEVAGTGDLQSDGHAGGRALVGGLIAGIPGAIIGAASTRREFQTTLALSAFGGTLGFLIRDAPPLAVRVAVEAIPAARALLAPHGIENSMQAASRGACRERAIFWAQLADAELEAIQRRNLTINALWARPTTMAAVAQAWATLALSAPDP